MVRRLDLCLMDVSKLSSTSIYAIFPANEDSCYHSARTRAPYTGRNAGKLALVDC